MSTEFGEVFDVDGADVTVTAGTSEDRAGRVYVAVRGDHAVVRLYISPDDAHVWAHALSRAEDVARSAGEAAHG